MCEALKGVKPVMVMVVVQIAYAGMNIFYKLAANDGMNLRVLVAYRMMFATVFIAPLALIFERGLLAQNLYIESLYLTSASFASAVTNLIPAVTFVLAVSFRMEEVGIGSMSGNAKVLGTLMGIGGAMLLTFYKGQQIVIWSTHVDLMHQNSHQMTSDSPPPTKSHVLGSFLAICCCFSYAIWLIIQGKMSRRYPCHYSSTALMSLMGSIQCVIFALCMNTQTKDWNLNLNIRLYTAAYSGIVTSGVAVALIAWCVVRRGPLFISIFNPLSPLLVTVAGSLVLDENMHLGRRKQERSHEKEGSRHNEVKHHDFDGDDVEERDEMEAGGEEDMREEG
ncbi:hypothetical protein LWI29_026289 [Acer saccharum]|uniref:WAT1-related protein n=1 Tax=Acer saccharum TaxID=4024 RepID=A0AA39VLK1_ACESA|nr:hypothetical protein LWI29_026289 [Acer saccharum]